MALYVFYKICKVVCKSYFSPKCSLISNNLKYFLEIDPYIIKSKTIVELDLYLLGLTNKNTLQEQSGHING